ncbi:MULTISPECIES: choice-of-anchor A family protein [unclassified Pseudoalteromonas]|uniref:choice-of-anchor A family protein n=1 Tax=unclassified Pseudoalteromonas TaxID=194690 RepID=UPI00048C8391|nr:MULTISPECIES: choice-of-anchor A family protein [unclassified Pseudoalteromonas]
MTNSLLKYKKLSAVIALTLASSTTLAADLGVANNFSAFVFNDFKSNFGRADGAIAAGEIDLKGYSVGYTRPYSPEEYYLISESTIDFKYGRQYVGSMVAGGGTDVHWSVRWGMEWGSKILSNQDESALPFNFDEQEQYYKDLSAQLGELDETGTVYRKWGGLYLQGDGSSDRQVFNVDARDFAKAHTFKVWGIPADATVIFNITGDDNVVVKGKSFARLRHHASKTVFNFTNAQKLDIKGNRWQGVILAPYADIRGVYGTAKMPIIGQSFYGSMALLGGEFDGDLPSSVELCKDITVTDLWSWTESEFKPEYKQIISTPIAVQLNDDNGDGIIDNNDVTDILAVTFDVSKSRSRAVVRAFNGINGEELWKRENQDGTSDYKTVYSDPTYSISAADINNDGVVEIITRDSSDYSLKIYSNTGDLIKKIALHGAYGNSTIADLDGDGYAEIIVGNTILSLFDDSIIKLTSPVDYTKGNFGMIDAVVFDYDLDGQQEVLGNGVLFTKDGNVLWNQNTQQGFSAVGNFDSDTYPEIVLTDIDGSVRLLEHDGSIIWQYQSADLGGGVPSIGDVDGDGEPDIVVAGGELIKVLNKQGALINSFNINDASSKRTGVVTYDFNGDGKAEIINLDETGLNIFSVSDNKLIYNFPQSSGTIWEYPLVVDLDGDGAGEIISVSNTFLLPNSAVGTNGLFVKSASACKSVDATRIWNQHSFSGTNINQNGSLPLQQENSWEKTNTFRSANLK